MKIILPLAAATLLLASCAAVKPNVYNTFDAANKSIAVKPVGSLFMDGVKQGLRTNGWKISIDGATSQTKNPINHVNPTAKYTLISHVKEEKPVGVASFFDPNAHIDITICENITGEEVLTYRDNGDQEKMSKSLVSTIQLHTK